MKRSDRWGAGEGRRLSLSKILLVFTGMVLGMGSFCYTSVAATVSQVTTHPALDYYPAPSQDGRFLAFVSDRSGNADIWLKSLGVGVVSLPRQVTTHPAIDRDPSLNADGSQLLYVSHKSDPRGDVYLMNLATFEEKRLTDLGTADSLPQWGRDGATIYYLSENVATGVQTLRKRSVSTNQEEAVMDHVSAFAVGRDGWMVVSKDHDLLVFPEQSPDQATSMDLREGLSLWPAISRGGYLTFTHYARDTNDDGVLDTNDQSAIWLSQWDYEQGRAVGLYQMTALRRYHLYPAMAQGFVYFTDLQDGNIFRMHTQEFLRDYASFDQAKALADRFLDRGDGDNGLVVLGNISRNLTEGLDGEARAHFDFAFADELIRAGEFVRAKQVIAGYLNHPGEIGALARIHQIALPLYQRQASMSEGELKRAVEAAVRDVMKIGETYRHHDVVYGQAVIEAGRLYLLAEDSLSALDYLVQVDEVSDKETRAKALFTRATIYRSLGEQRNVVGVFIDVIKMFGEESSWGKRAIAQAIAVIEDEGENVHQRVASLQALITQQESFKLLIGNARLRIAELYQEAGEQVKAIQALDQLLDDPPPSDALVTLAYRRKADILSSAQRYKEAAEVYAVLVARTGGDPTMVTQAQDLMVLQLVREAQKERNIGEVRIAAKAFRKIAEDYPNSVEAHRGYIETKVMLNELPDVLKTYQELVQKSPDSPVFLYGLALAWSYQEPLDVFKVIGGLEEAIRLDPGVSYYHQTLGWAYEQAEQLEGQEGFLEKAEQEYRIALQLNDEFQFPEVESNLLLNLGNTYRTLGNFQEAYRVYRQRDVSYQPAGDSVTELLYRKNYGEACFKSGHTEEALKQYQQAYDRVPPDQKALKAELLERMALSYQDLGHHAKAVDAFSQALQINVELGNSENLALLQRNIGVSLYNLSASSRGGRREALKRALKSYFSSLEMLKQFGGKKQKEGAGLLNIDVALDAEGSQAAGGFDRKGEEKLMFSYIAGTYERLSEPKPARDYYLKKLQLLDEGGAEGNVALLTEKAVVLNRVGILSHQLGEDAQALDYFRQSLGYTKTLSLPFGTAVNVYNLSRLAARRVLEGQSVDWSLVTNLVESLDQHVAAGYADAATFYALTNTAFLLHYLDEPSSLGSAPSQDAVRAMYEFADLKRRVWSYYEKAEQLLVKESVLPSTHQLPTAIILQLNKMELARVADDQETYEQIQKELSNLVREKPSPNSWLMLLAQAEYAKEAGAQQALLAQAFDAVLSLPPQVSDPEVEATALVAGLRRLSKLYVDRLVEAHSYNRALEVADRLAMREQVVRLQTALGDDLFFKGIGPYEQDLRNILAEIREVMGGKDPETYHALLRDLDEFLLAMFEEYPAATSYFWQYPLSTETLTPLLHADRVYVKLVEGKNSLYGFVHDGAEVHYLPVFLEKGQFSLTNEWHAFLKGKEGVYVSVPDQYAGLLQKVLAPTQPVVHVVSFYDFVNGYHQRSLFYSQVGTIGAVELEAGLTAGDVPLSVHAFTGIPSQDHPILDRLEVLITTQPLQGMNVVLTEELQVHEYLPVIRLADRPHHTAMLLQSSSSTKPLSDEVITALIRAGFPHVVVLTGVETQKANQFFSLYLAYLNDLPSDVAFTMAKSDVWGERMGEGKVELYGYAGMNEEERASFAADIYDQELSTAVSLFQSHQFAPALQKMEHALSVINYANKSADFADLTKLAVEASFKIGDYQKAVYHQERLVATLDESTQPEARAEALYRLGILYSRLEQFEESIQYLKQAIDWWTKAEELDRLAEGIAQLGVVRENMGAYSEALSAFGQSFALYEEIGEIGDVATQHRRIGRIYYLRLARYEKAREQFQSALDLYRQVQDSQGEAETLYEIGLTYDKMGLFDQADEQYRAGQRIGETLNSPYLLATGNLYLANTAWFRGNYQEAFQYLAQADKLAQEADDVQLAIMVKNTRGLMYWTLNDLEKGLAHLKQAVALAEKADIRTELASSLNNLGLIYRQQGDAVTSLEYFRRAKDIDERLKSRWGLGYDYRNIGMALLKLDRLDEALAHFVEAARISAEIKNATNWVKALLELGNVHRRLNHPDQAVEYYTQAYELSGKYGIKEVRWRAAAGHAAVLRERRQAEEAFSWYADAVNVVEGMRAALKIEELRNSFQANKQDLYRETISLLVEMGRTDEAFNYLERSRSRSFIDLLGNQKLTLKSEADQKALDRIHELARRVEALTQEAGSYEEIPEELHDRLREAKATYEEAKLELKQHNPALNSFVSVDPLTLPQVQELLDPGVALLSYFVGKNTTFIWLIQRDKAEFFQTPGGEVTLDPLVKQYRNLVQHAEPVDRELRTLYANLIKPLEGELKGVEYVGIIPDGVLHFLSFSALKHDEVYLIDRYPLFYSPSASVLEFTFAKRKETKRTKVLAIGNPDLGNYNYDLPLAELEAQSIKWNYPDMDILTGAKATKEWVIENISRYGIIHLAAHGEFNEINPLFSSLWLSSPHPNNRKLTVQEVFGLEINADLVTLSACQTGLGKLNAGELIGLNRAFIYAGTHALVSALWRVDDLSTSVLMKHFYRNYVTMDKAKSLRQAQLIVKKEFPHPSYWAGFNLVGDYL